MSEETEEIRAMRAMAWQRAKGELSSMAETFYADHEKEYRPKEFKSKYDHFKDLLDYFVDEIESHELNR